MGEAKRRKLLDPSFGKSVRGVRDSQLGLPTFVFVGDMNAEVVHFELVADEKKLALVSVDRLIALAGPDPLKQSFLQLLRSLSEPGLIIGRWMSAVEVKSHLESGPASLKGVAIFAPPYSDVHVSLVWLQECGFSQKTADLIAQACLKPIAAIAKPRIFANQIMASPRSPQWPVFGYGGVGRSPRFNVLVRSPKSAR